MFFIHDDKSGLYSPLPMFFSRDGDSIIIDILVGASNNTDFNLNLSNANKSIFLPYRAISLEPYTKSAHIIDPDLNGLCPGMHFDTVEIQTGPSNETRGVVHFHGHTFYVTQSKLKPINSVDRWKVPYKDRFSILEPYWHKIKKFLPKEKLSELKSIFFSPLKLDPPDLLMTETLKLASEANASDISSVIDKVKDFLKPYVTYAEGAEAAALLVSHVMASFGPKSPEYIKAKDWFISTFTHSSIYKQLFHALFTMGITELSKQDPIFWNSQAVCAVQGEMLDFYVKAEIHGDPCDKDLLVRVFQWMDNIEFGKSKINSLGELFYNIQIRNNQLEARDRFVQKHLEPHALDKVAVGVISDFYLRKKLQRLYQQFHEEWPGLSHRGVLKNETLKSGMQAEILTHWKGIVTMHERLNPEAFKVDKRALCTP